MNAQFKKGILEICVLVLLEKKDCYGYELVQMISRKVEVAEGSMYPILRRFTKDGYCTTYLQESTDGPSRKYYTLTEEGKEYLQKQMAEWKAFNKAVNQLIEEGDDNE